MPEFNRNRTQGQRPGGPPRGGREPGGGRGPQRDGGQRGEGDSQRAAVPWYVGQSFQDASPGHRYLLYLPFWKDDWRAIKEGKQQVLKNVGAMPPTTIDTMRALASRQREIGRAINAEVIEAVSTSPFATGLGWEHPNENGFAFLHPYGLAYLAGSGVKGVLRRAAEEYVLLGPQSGMTLLDVWWLYGFEGAPGAIWERDGIWADAYARHKSRLMECPDLPLFLEKIGAKDDPNKKKTLEERLDDVARNRRELQFSGALRFLDVIPEIAGNAMGVDIMNPHYGKYYQGNTTPHDAGSPVPIFFLVVPPGSKFCFVVDCPREHLLPEELKGKWRALIRTTFEYTFDWLGFGAKTAVGYGAMTDKPVPAQSEHPAAPTATRRDTTKSATPETVWPGARLKFSLANRALTAEAGGKQAHALAPKGEELLATLPAAIQAKVRRNEFVKVNVVVQGGALVRVEVP